MVNIDKKWVDAYDKSRKSYLLTTFVYEKVFKKIRFYRSVRKTEKILDIGCGDGKVLFFLEKKGYKNLHGFDLRKISCKNTGIKFKQGNMLSMPYKDSFADVMLCFNVMHHCTTHNQYLTFISECKRILKPSGTLYLLEPHNTLTRKLSTFICFLPILKHIGIFKQKRIIFEDEKKEHQMFFETNIISLFRKNGFSIFYKKTFLESIILKLINNKRK